MARKLMKEYRQWDLVVNNIGITESMCIRDEQEDAVVEDGVFFQKLPTVQVSGS